MKRDLPVRVVNTAALPREPNAEANGDRKQQPNGNAHSDPEELLRQAACPVRLRYRGLRRDMVPSVVVPPTIAIPRPCTHHGLQTEGRRPLERRIAYREAVLATAPVRRRGGWRDVVVECLLLRS